MELIIPITVGALVLVAILNNVRSVVFTRPDYDALEYYAEQTPFDYVDPPATPPVGASCEDDESR